VIVFRVSIDNKSGLGHLTRCVVLAREIQNQGEDVLFVGDFIDEKTGCFLSGINHVSLYEAPHEILNEEQDAQLFLGHISSYSKSLLWVVVDHYHLSAVWEKTVSLKKLSVMAIDDLVRKHHCQAILDYKWNGGNAAELYAEQGREEVQLLLGPDYLLVPTVTAGPSFEQDKVSNITSKLLIGLGGGGDAKILEGLLTNLLLESETSEKLLYIKVIVGPFLKD
jgi:spore coat polysaccharide biosynthesis predicted glycosyltransferase SpsG